MGPGAGRPLRAACEQWDAYQAARAELAEDGPTVVNPKSGLVRQHPAHTIARDSLREFRQLFRQLELEPPKEA